MKLFINSMCSRLIWIGCHRKLRVPCDTIFQPVLLSVVNAYLEILVSHISTFDSILNSIDLLFVIE